MIITISIFILFLAYVGYKLSDDILSPAVLSTLPWAGVLLLYGTIDHGLYPLSNVVLMSILIWVVAIFSGSCLVSHLSWRRSETAVVTLKEQEAFNPMIRWIYYALALICSVGLFYIAYMQGTTMKEGSFFFNLRMANTGLVYTPYQYGIFIYGFTFAFISLMMELYVVSRKNIGRVSVLVILNLLLAIITMSKSSFFFLFLGSGVVLMFKYRIKYSYIIAGCGALLLVMSLVQMLRGGFRFSVIEEMLRVYVLGGIPALDEVIKADMHSVQWGQQTLRFFRTVGSLLGVSDGTARTFVNDVTVAGNGYVYTPLPTNVFTVIGPIWWDFGYKGIAFIGLLIGGFTGFLYQKAKEMKSWAVVVYAHFAAVLILQFFGEYIFATFSYTLQVIFLPLVASKFKYIVKWLK